MWGQAPPAPWPVQLAGDQCSWGWCSGREAVASSRAGWGLPQQAVHKPLPRSVPLPFMASGFAALSNNVKEIVPSMCPILPTVPPGPCAGPCPFPACRLCSVWL